MKLERRHFLSAVGATGVLLTARPSRAASIADWVAGAGMMSRFAAAGIPQRSLVISSGSTLPTLLPQDAVLTDLRGAGKLPDRGEIVAFTSKNGAVYAKRLIGLPGDRIAFRIAG